MKRCYLILFLTIITHHILVACSCSDFSNVYHYNTADQIFEGEVLSEHYKKRGLTKKIKFKIRKKYKGNFKSSTVTLISNFGSSDCGLNVSKKEIWLVFVKGGISSICLGSYQIRKDKDSPLDPQNGLSIDISVVDSVKKYSDSYYEKFDSLNRIIAEGSFKQGKAHGEWTYYQHYPEYFGTTQILTINYNNGIQEGLTLDKNEDGTLRFTANYKDGKRNGHFVQYGKNGQKWNEGYYKDDLKIGEWISYDDDGSIQYLRRYDAKGRKVYDETRSKKGEALRHSITKYRLRNKIVISYKDGKFVEKSKYKLNDYFY